LRSLQLVTAPRVRGSAGCTAHKTPNLRPHRERADSTLRFTSQELQRLSEASPGPSVSCYLPTHRNPPEKKEDRLRFRNLLSDAEGRLIGDGLRRPEARRLLEPASELLEDEPFWESVWDGLAVFISPGLFRRYTVARALREFVDVGDRFHLKPLLPVLQRDGRFFLLGLSQRGVALYEGTPESLVERPVRGLPQDLASALFVEQFPPERDLRFRIQTPDLTRYLVDFLQSVDRAVNPALRGERAPLVLAAVEYLHPLYAQVNSYPHLFPAGIRGNPQTFPIAELHRRAASLATAAVERDVDQAVADYAEIAGSTRASQELSTILVGAFFGTVGRLFVPSDVELWGRFDPETLEVVVHDRREMGDVDLADWAAVRILSNDGEVITLPRDRIPGRGPLAALFRY